jgi:hypothetical protein
VNRLHSHKCLPGCCCFALFESGGREYVQRSQKNRIVGRKALFEGPEGLPGKCFGFSHSPGGGHRGRSIVEDYARRHTLRGVAGDLAGKDRRTYAESE